METQQNGPWLALAGGLVLAVLLLGALAGLGVGSDPSPGSGVAVDLLEELSDGGEVLVFRHAITDTSQTDADPQARGSCAQQRNLSAEGLQQARRIGRAMQALPVSAVYASPFCRTVETARAFDVGPVEVTDALVSTTAAADAAGRQAIRADMAQLVASHLGGPGLAVMVTHTQNIEALTDLHLEEGDAVVLSAAPDGGVDTSIIRADDW